MKVNQLTYSLTGAIDASNAKQVQANLLSFIANSLSSIIIIDFQKVEFLDSAGLMALVAGYQEAKKLNKDFAIFGVSPAVRIIFEVSQLDQILGVRDDIKVNDYWDHNLIAA